MNLAFLNSQPVLCLVTLLSLVLYMATIINVGRARMKFMIDVPTVTGPPEFERIFRVQQNTLESLIVFLPALWIFAFSVNVSWAVILGGVWLLGRLLYAVGYADQASKRFVGFALGTLVNIVLVLGSLGSIAFQLFQ